MMPAASAPVTPLVERAGLLPVDTLTGQLDDLASVLLSLNRVDYTEVTAPGVSGSIGSHVRHLLDHVAAFIKAGGFAVLSYDHRERGTEVEVNPQAALTQLLRLQAALETMARRQQDEHVRVRTQLTADGEAITSWSTLGRELAFVASHTVHHQAMIALLMARQGRDGLPDRFGYAPSTPRQD